MGDTRMELYLKYGRLKGRAKEVEEAGHLELAEMLRVEAYAADILSSLSGA